MRSSKRATIILVAILLSFLLSFVSAELNKRDPQAPDAPPAGGGDGGAPKEAPPAGGDATPPAGGAGGNAPEEPPAGKAKDAPPAGGNAPAGDAPPAEGAGGNAPAGPGGNQPGGNQPGGNQPGGNQPGGNQPGGNQPGGGDNSTIPPKYVPPNTPQIGVVMIEPKTTKNLLYRIGTNITFKWGYSDKFVVPPLSLMVAAQPEVNKAINYTIAQNLALNDTQEVTWDTSLVSSLPMSKYFLIICDQDGPNAPPKPGGLLKFSTLQFGLYPPQEPSNCDVCNNAISIPTSLLSTIGLALISIISFSFISI